jgi:cathepsin B
VGHSIFTDGSILSKATHKISTDKLPNHAAAIVGWGGEGFDGKFWLVQNAYGVGNGENGVMKVKRGTNEFEIEQHTSGYEVELIQ